MNPFPFLYFPCNPTDPNRTRILKFPNQTPINHPQKRKEFKKWIMYRTCGSESGLHCISCSICSFRSLLVSEDTELTPILLLSASRIELGLLVFGLGITLTPDSEIGSGPHSLIVLKAEVRGRRQKWESAWRGERVGV